MKYGTMRWLAVMMTVAGLTLSGCNRSGSQATPVDQFTGGTDNQGSGVTNITNAAGTFVVGTISSPSYQINPLNGLIVPTRATTTSVGMSGIFTGAITGATSADRMRVYVDRIPWGTTLDDNGSAGNCGSADWLVIDTGVMNAAAVDPDATKDGVSACTNAGVGCAALPYAPFAARSGFIAAGGAGNGSTPAAPVFPLLNAGTVVGPTTIAIPAGSLSTGTICDAVVPVRVTPSGGTNRAWSTLSEFPVRLLPNEFWVTFRFEYFRNNNLTATTYPGCYTAPCFDPTLTMQQPIVSGQKRVGDFPFSFDSLPPYINVSAYSRATTTFTVATAGGNPVNSAAAVTKTVTINGTTFTVLDTGTAVANPETEFQFVDDGDGVVTAADADANGRAFAALINLNPAVNSTIRAYASGSVVTLTAIDRGTGASILAGIVSGGAGTDVTITPGAVTAGQAGASSVASLVTGGVPRQMAFGPVGFTETFTDLSTTAGGSLIALGSENFTAMNAQRGDIVTFLSDSNNGRTRPIAQVAVDTTIQENAGGSATVVTSVDPNLSNVPDYYVGGSLEATFGTAGNLGQRLTIVDYDGAGTFTVSPGFSAANAAGDAYRLRTAGAGTSPNGVLLETPARADSSSAVMQLAHADIQALRPKEAGGAVVYTATNIARTNSALVSGVVQEGRPAYIYFETSASAIPGPDGGDLLFITTQTGYAANHVRVELTETLAPLTVNVELPANLNSLPPATVGIGGYVGGPDNTSTLNDEGDAIVSIGYANGVTTLLQIYGAVTNHPVARQFVSPAFAPANALATIPVHAGSNTIPEIIPPLGLPTVDPISTGGFVPAVGTGVASVAINGVNVNVPSQPAVSAVISRSSAAADKTTASAVTEDRTAGGVAVPNTAIRFYARTAGYAGNGLNIAVVDGPALNVADASPNVTITVPAGTTSDQIVEFVNEGTAATLTNDDGGAGGRDDVTFTNVTSGSVAANGYSVRVEIQNCAGPCTSPNVSVTIGAIVDIVAQVFLNTTTAAELVNLINTDPEAQLYVQASLTAGPSIAGPTAGAAPVPTTTTFVDGSATPLSATNEFYTGGTLTFTSGANAGLTRQIVSYTGATKTFKVSPGFPVAPAATDAFTVVNTNDGQFAINNAFGPSLTVNGSGRSTLVKAMHDGASTGAGIWDAATGIPVVTTTYGGSDPTSQPVANANSAMTGRIVSNNANVVIGQYQGGQCLPSFLDQSYGSTSSICFTASMAVAEGTTNFNVTATDGSGNQTTDAAQSAIINPATFTQLYSCSSSPTGVTVGAADRCEVVDAAAAPLNVVRDLSQPVLAADLEGVYDPTRYETLATIDCSAPPANSFCSQPVFVIPANAPSGGGAYTSFSPTVTVGGHVLDKNANASAFDTAAAGMTLVRVQTDNGYDSFNAPTGLDDNGSPVPYTDGDAVPAENNGYYQYSNISLRTGALTQFTVTAWDQAGNMTTFNFAVRQFEGNVKTPPHFAIDCIVEDTPQMFNGGGQLLPTDGNTPARAVMCENDAGSVNPNTPIVVRTLDMQNTNGVAGGRFGDLGGEQGPTVVTPPPADVGSNATTIVFLGGGPIVTDNFFVGDTITVVTGALANIGQTRTVVAWNDATATATVSPAFPAPIAAGDTLSLASYGLFNTGTPTLLAVDAIGTNLVLNTDETLPYLSDVNDAYVGGTVTVVTTGGASDLTVGQTGTITDYDATTATFTVTGLAGTTSDVGDTFILRSGDGRNYRGVGELANLGAGVLPQIDFRTVRSDRIYLQGRTLALDASSPTVYVGSDPTIVNNTSDIMPADGNTTGNQNDFLRLVQAGGNGGSTISIANPGIAVNDNIRVGDYIALSSLDPTKSPNIGLYRILDCGVPDANGYCNGAGPKTVTLDKPMPADASGMFLQAAYVWTAPNVPVPVEGINSFLFVAIDSMLTDVNDATSGNQSVTPFAVIRDTFPPSIVVQGVINDQTSIGYNPVVFITDETLFLGNSFSLPSDIASRIDVIRQDNFGEDTNAGTPNVPAAFSIFSDSLVSTSIENTPNAAQSLLSTQTNLGQASAALLDGTPVKPLAIDNSCNDANAAPVTNPCSAGDKLQYRIVVQANDRVNHRSPLQVQFNLVQSATDRVLSGALEVISKNPAVVSLLSDPTELSTLTLDQISNSGVLYNLNYHTSVLLGGPKDTAATNPRQAFYQDSRTDMGIVLGTLLQDTDGTGPSESTVVILANVGRILLDNGVLDDLLPLLDDQAIINPRARDAFPAGPRTDPGDATLSSVFLEEIMRDAAEAATPCNVGVNAYNCYSQPGTVKNTLPMVKSALDSAQSLRVRAADVAGALNDSLNARTSGTDLVVDGALVADPATPGTYWARVSSAQGGFLTLGAALAQADSEINVQEDDIVMITSGACSGAKARVKKVANVNNIAPYNVAPFNVNADNDLFVEPFTGVFTSTATGGTATTLTDANLRDGAVDDPTYVGRTVTFLTGANAGQTATVLLVGGYDGTQQLTFGNCQPSNAACAVTAAGDQYSVNEVLATACVGAGAQSFRVMQPQGPSMEPIFDLVDNLLFLDLDGDGQGGEREVIQSLIYSAEEAMADPNAGTAFGPGVLGSYPTVADRISLVCTSANAGANTCPTTLAEKQDAPSLQGVLDLIYELSDDQDPFTGYEFIPRVLNIVTAALSQYPREATNPQAPNGATVLEAASFILRDMLTDQTTGGLLSEPSKATPAYTSLAAESGPADNYKNSRLNLMMRSTYIMGPNGAFVSPADDQVIALKGPTNVTVTNILEALFPLLQTVTDDPDDNPRGIGAPPFTYTVGQSVAEKLLPAVDLVLRDKRLENLVADLSAVLDPGTSVSDLTAFDYNGPVLNTGYADQAANPYTVNPPLLKVVAELSGAKINYNLDGVSTRSTLDYTNDALNVLLTRVGRVGLNQDNVSYDNTPVHTAVCNEAYFNGRTPMEMLLEVMAQLADTTPKDPRSSNFRDAGCTAFNAGGANANRSYLRVLVDGLFDDPNRTDIGASDPAVNDKTDFDDSLTSPVAGAAYPGAGCTTNRGPNGGDGIAVAQSTIDILPEVLNTMVRFGFNEQDQITSIFSTCVAGPGCEVNNGYPNGVDQRWLSSARLGIDLALQFDKPFQVGSGSGFIRFEQSLIREALEQISVMSSTQAVNYVLLLVNKIAEDIQPINGTLDVPNPQDIARSSASVRALADPDGDGNPAPDGLLDDIIPVAQALGASGMADQTLKLLRAVRACGVDTAPGADGRDIKGGALLKSSEDLTLILLDAYSGARARDDDNDGTGRNVDALTTPDFGAPICPSTVAAGADPAKRGYTGGPLDQNPPRETVAVTGGVSVTTVDVDATVGSNGTLNLNPGFYSGTGAYAANGAGLITFKTGTAKGLTRRITNYTVLGNVGTLTFATTGGPVPAIGDQIELSLSSVNVGVLTGGNDIALTSDGATLVTESRVWGAATELLPPSTTDFNKAGVGPGSFLCVQTRSASEDGGYDEICSPVTQQPPVTAPLDTASCSANDSRNCLKVEQAASQAANWGGSTYDDLAGYMTQNCNQIEYAATGGSAVTIVLNNAALATAAAVNGNTWFNGHKLIATTTAGGLTAGDQLTITATNTALAPQITFTVTGAPGAIAAGATVRFFDGQQCSYRVRQMREPYNGCFGGTALGGQGLGTGLSSFGGASPITINPFRDSRMDLLLRAVNSLADGVNAVDTGPGPGVADQDFFDRVLALVTVAIQPNTDPLAQNNRSIASNLIFGPDGTDGTGQGPVQRLLNDNPTRSAITAAGSLFGKLTAHVTAPVDPNPSSANGEDVYDRYPNFDNAFAGPPLTGWPQPVGVANCLNPAQVSVPLGVTGTCDGNAINDAVDYQLLAVAGILETLGTRDGQDGVSGANTIAGSSRQGFSDDPRILFNIASQFIEADLIRQLIPGIQIITEQTTLVPAGARDAKSTKVTDNNAGPNASVGDSDDLIIEGAALTNIISRTARSMNGDTNGIDYDGRIYDAASYAGPVTQRPVITGMNISPTYGLVKTVVALLDDWEQNLDYDPAAGIDPVPFDTANAEYDNNLRYRNKLVALEDLAANLIGSQRVGIEHPFNTQNYLGKALKLLTDIVNDTDVTSLSVGGHDRTIDNILSVQIGLSQRDIIDTPTVIDTDYYRSGMDVVGDFLNTMLEDPTDCDTVTLGFQRGVAAANPYNACVGGGANSAANTQAVFRDRGALVERPLQPILDENLFSSLSVLLAGDSNSKVVGALPFISAVVDSQTYALDNDPVSGTAPLPPTGQGNAPGCASGGSDRIFCGVEYTAGVTVADALFADIQTLIPGSATVNPRVKREDDENRYDPLVTDDLNRSGFIGDTALAGVFDTTFGGGGPWMSVFDAPAVLGCTTGCPSTEVDNIVFDCSPPPGTAAGSPAATLPACTTAAGDPEASGTPVTYPNRRVRIGFTATDGVVTQGNVNGINAALFDGLADLIAREDPGFVVNNQIPRTSTQLQTMDQLTVRQLQIPAGGGLPVDRGFVDLVTALGDILITSSVH